MNASQILLTTVERIWSLFEELHGHNASNWQISKVSEFKRKYPSLVNELDFCFEVLAGKHKLGFKAYDTHLVPNANFFNFNYIKSVVEALQEYTKNDKSEFQIRQALNFIPTPTRPFFIKLLNREYRLGYTNKNNMVTDKHPMLAKTYPEGVKSYKKYYIQEKLNGNRCITFFHDGEWHYISRSQKPMKVKFDTEYLDPNYIYDGEIMTKDKMTNADFSTTSGIINSKTGDKSQLVYIVYDLAMADLPYSERYRILHEEIKPNLPKDSNITILNNLDYLLVSPFPETNEQLDAWLDKITSKGGEGIMLRDPDSPYHHSKHSGDRKNYLLKYKKLKTCDLRIVGFNEGNGKYTGLIGSFICEDDEGTLRVNVSGMTDEVRWSNPNEWIGKIIEVAYFDNSKSKSKSIASLQHPRMKRVRDDKTETSLF